VAPCAGATALRACMAGSEVGVRAGPHPSQSQGGSAVGNEDGRGRRIETRLPDRLAGSCAAVDKGSRLAARSNQKRLHLLHRAVVVYSTLPWSVSPNDAWDSGATDNLMYPRRD
jgi:hypothetical protein